jgi:Fe-S-cluster containining protein
VRGAAVNVIVGIMTLRSPNVFNQKHFVRNVTWRMPSRRLRCDMPIFHECQRCTACCRWPGQVRLTDAEITRLAAFQQLSEVDFIQQFTRLSADRQGLSLLDKPNGECIFLMGEDCSVQPVKPQQCRNFPNLWNFPGFEKICHAIPRLVSETEYAQLLARATTSKP